MSTARPPRASKSKVTVAKKEEVVVTSSSVATAGRKRTASTAASTRTTVTKKKVKIEGLEGSASDNELTEEEEEIGIATPQLAEEEHKCELEESDSGEESEDETSTKHKKKKAPVKKAAAKPRAKKVKKEEDMGPLRLRTPNLRVFLGAHISAAGGPMNAVQNSLKIGGNAFALFLKSQRKWASKELAVEDADAFKKAVKEANYDSIKHCLPHGSYLVNLAQEEKAKQHQAYDCFIDDLKRCEMLNIGLYNFHPGSTLGLPREDAIARIATMLNRAHKETKFVKTVLENMAGQGNIIGSRLEDLRDIIALVDDKSRMGVCIDTCHSFAAGFDLRTQETSDAFWNKFDEIVGWKYLCAMHINDSKAPLGSHLDRHENIGLGFLGLEAFRLVVNRKELEDIPLILETPMKEQKDWADEIALLESLIGIGPEDPVYLEKAKVLSAKGKADRDKAMETYNKKIEAEAKKKEKAEKKGGKQTTLTAMVKAKTTVAKKVTKRKVKASSDQEESDLTASE